MTLPEIRSHLLQGQAIPALPLALDTQRRWSERHQQAVLRYYREAGAGGLAVGVHSTQFQIRDPAHGLFEPVLELAAHTLAESSPTPSAAGSFLKIAGLCGSTSQAVREAGIAAKFGYDAGLLSLAAWADEPEETILDHCRIVADHLPLIGFYLQPAVGGRLLSYAFWRRFAEIPDVVAIKIAPFNRYQTLDVVRAVIKEGRDDIALYTGNDDNIIIDLLTPFRFEGRTRPIAGGLLGQWGVWTRAAVTMLEELKTARQQARIDSDWLTRAAELTDANAAVFDAAHQFAGCLPGIHEVLRRQGLFATTACLDPGEQLSPGQAEELNRVTQAYSWLTDDDFVRENLDRWLR
jgi:dihydrodipicolinate synthase/N-acetylneuraminate lyase